MPTLTLLHTAQIHCATFEALQKRFAPDLTLVHLVREDWLETARTEGITTALQRQIQEEIAKAPNQVLCSCTTLGKTAEDFGAIRVDRPMMETAAQRSGPILLVYVLESTAEPSLSLLNDSRLKYGHNTPIHVLFLPKPWQYFECGDLNSFRREIALGIRAKLAAEPEIETIVMAQASMATASSLLGDVKQTVLTSPETAFLAVLGKMHQK